MGVGVAEGEVGLRPECSRRQTRAGNEEALRGGRCQAVSGGDEFLMESIVRMMVRTGIEGAAWNRILLSISPLSNSPFQASLIRRKMKVVPLFPRELHDRVKR
eukprot:752999-Hanusia_phi.AAC.4